jgi:hypothetical protein
MDHRDIGYLDVMWIEVDQDSAPWRADSFKNSLSFSNTLKAEYFLHQLKGY